MADMQRRNAEEIIWQVLTSFGFDEEDAFTERDRYFILDKKEAALVTRSNPKSRAEAVSACIETAFALGADEFSVHIFDENIYEILERFGFSNILAQDGNFKNGFALISGGTVFAEGTFKEEKTIARLDIERLLKVCENSELISSKLVSKTLVFAEKDAEGVAYDICYNLRVNGCIVEMYCGDGDIIKAEAYAEKDSFSAIIRCFADGKIEIKDNGEIIKTTVSDFLGYYEDGCGCEHHGDDCDCGHHHG